MVLKVVTSGTGGGSNGTVTQVDTGTGLTGGGTSGDVTISLDTSSVVLSVTSGNTGRITVGGTGNQPTVDLSTTGVTTGVS